MRAYKLEDLVNKKVIIFGSGRAGKQTVVELEKQNIHISYLCDNNTEKHNTKLNNNTIFSPNKLQEENKDKIAIIVAALENKDICEQLEKMGIYNYYEYNKIEYLYNRETLLANLEEIDGVINIFNDEKSKQCYHELKNYIIGKNETLNCICTSNMYFDSNIFEFSNNEVFIDAGAYNGDTIIQFVKFIKEKFKKVYAFEPDETNYKNIIKDFKDSRIIIENKGVYSENTILRFKSDFESSSVRNDGAAFISAIKLDDYIKEKVTFIKMDIEGSEKQALIGAKNIIQKYKPKLAICIYHRTEDLWEIPQIVKEYVPEYKIYVRHHSKYGLDTVLYATL